MPIAYEKNQRLTGLGLLRYVVKNYLVAEHIYHFGKGDEKELQRFIDIAKKLLPLKRWLVSSNEDLLMKTMSSTDYQDIKQQSNNSIECSSYRYC